MRGVLRTHFRRDVDLALALSGPAVEDGTVGVVCDRRGAVQTIMMKLQGRAVVLSPVVQKPGGPCVSDVLSCERGPDQTPDYKAIEAQVIRGYGAGSRAEARRRIYASILDLMGGEA